MKAARFLFLLLLLTHACLAGGFRSGWRGSVGSTGSYDTLGVPPVGPLITILTEDEVVYSADWRFTASVDWGDGEYVDVFVYAELDQDYNLVSPGYLKGQWAGLPTNVFNFPNNAYANLMFRDEADDDVIFTVYALDDNGMYDVWSKKVTFLPE